MYFVNGVVATYSTDEYAPYIRIKIYGNKFSQVYTSDFC